MVRKHQSGGAAKDLLSGGVVSDTDYMNSFERKAA